MSIIYISHETRISIQSSRTECAFPPYRYICIDVEYKYSGVATISILAVSSLLSNSFTVCSSVWWHMTCTCSYLWSNREIAEMALCSTGTVRPFRSWCTSGLWTYVLWWFDDGYAYGTRSTQVCASLHCGEQRTVQVFILLDYSTECSECNSTTGRYSVSYSTSTYGAYCNSKRHGGGSRPFLFYPRHFLIVAPSPYLVCIRHATDFSWSFLLRSIWDTL